MSSTSSVSRVPTSGKFTGECHAARQLNRDGTVHQHGPRTSRCPGSNRPPFALLSTSQPPPAPYITGTGIQTSTQLSSPSSQPSSTLFAPQSPIIVDHPQCVGKVVKHIPRTARPHCARQLAVALNRVLADPCDLQSWCSLLGFTGSILAAPPRAGRRHKIVSVIIKRHLDDVFSGDVRLTTNAARPRRDDASALAAAVRAKIVDGNIRAAARIICSDEKPADEDGNTLEALRQRHPPAPADRAATPDPTLFCALQVTEPDVIRAMRSFPTGSSGGPDGLRPQHLVDMISSVVDSQALVTAITGFANLLLKGCCPPEVVKVLFGGRMFALQKKSGGVRPIAVGYTWRRLAAKCANSYALASLGDRFLPVQVGVGVQGVAKEQSTPLRGCWRT